MQTARILVVALVLALLGPGVPTVAADRTVNGNGAVEGKVSDKIDETRTLHMGDVRFRVAEAVKNFDKVKVGERVLIDYKEISGVRVATRITRDLPED